MIILIGCPAKSRFAYLLISAMHMFIALPTIAQPLSPSPDPKVTITFPEELPDDNELDAAPIISNNQVFSAHARSDRKSILLWDTKNGRAIRELDTRGGVPLAFDSSSTLLLSSGDDRDSVIVWDLATGKSIFRETLPKPMGSVARAFFIGDTDTFAVLGGAGRIRIWSLRTKKIMLNWQVSQRVLPTIAVSPNGMVLITASGEEGLRFWDIKTGKLLREVQLSDRLNIFAIKVSSDSRIVAIGRDSSAVELRRIDDGSLVRTMISPSSQIGDLEFSPDGRFLLGEGWNPVSETAQHHVWQLDTGGLVRTTDGPLVYFPGDTVTRDGQITAQPRILPSDVRRQHEKVSAKRIEGSDYCRQIRESRDGKTVLQLATANHFSEIQKWSIGDVVKHESIRIEPRPRAKGCDFLLSDSGDIGVLHPSRKGSSAISVIDLRQGKVISEILPLSPPVAVAISGDGALVAVGFFDGSVTVYSTKLGREIYTIKAHSEQILVLALSVPSDSLITNDYSGSTKVWSLSTGVSRTNLKRFNTVGSLLEVLSDYDGKAEAIKLSRDGAFAAVQYESSNLVRIYEVQSGRLKLTLRGVSSVEFSSDEDQLLVGREGLVDRIDLATWRVVVSEPYKSGFPLPSTKRRRALVRPSGIATLFDVVSGLEQLDYSYYHAPGGQPFIVTKEGYFAGDHSLAEKSIHISRGIETFSAGQIVDHMFRPDLVSELMLGDREGKYQDAASKLDLATVLASGPTPQIEYLDEKTETGEGSIRLSVRVTGRGGGVGTRMLWRVNGVTQGTTNPPDLTSADSPLASVVVNQTLRLVPGQVNTVEVIAYNRASLVATPPLKIIVDKFGASTTERPRMFVLALGVNKYRMKELQLSYAAADAISFAKALTVVGSSLFSEVRAKALTDEQVSEAGIVAAVDQIAREAKPEDVFVLFLGGHGKSIGGRYYYYQQSLDFAAGQTVPLHAIGQDKWETWLARIPVQKSLLVIDTCEGDAFRGSRGTDSARQTAMAQLQHATGRNIIAASREAAYEGYRGHGVLTYAILEALDKKSNAGSDDRVRVTALAEHVGVRVPDISRSTFGIIQNPTRRLSGNDFPIGIRQSVLTAAGASDPAIPEQPTHVLIRAELVRDRPAADAPGSRELAAGTQVRAVDFVGAWATVAREGQRLGYVPVEALVRMQ